MKTVNLYNEDGIVVYLDGYGDLTDKQDAVVAVIGHEFYACSLDDAQESIRREYLSL